MPTGAKTLKIELHLHTNRYSPCAKHTAQEGMARLIEAGYDAVYITEHDAVWSQRELDGLRAEFPAITIFPGVEVGTMPLTGKRLQHLVVLGTHDPTYIGLAERPGEIIARARGEGCLAVLAHPFRWPEASQMLTEGIVPDALEAYTVNHGEAGAREALVVAEKLGIPAVNAGDVHALDFIDRYWIETDQELRDAKDIRRIVTARLYRNVVKGR